jgi:branched-chain amino acid transport system ATP-binding protein
MIRALNADKLRLETGEYVLSVQQMRAAVGARTRLERIDLDVKRGTVTVLVGPAGAGKSLTLACIAGAARVTSGRVRYFGYELRGRPQERIVRLGIVGTSARPQSFGSMSVLETVMVGALLRRPRVGRARAYALDVLARTGLTECAPLRFAQLTEVNRRRLELARALATDPQVLLVDDLAGDLEPPDAALLGALLGEVRARGVTIVGAARSLDHFPLTADTVVAIDHGRTAELGNDAALDLR